MDKTVIVKLWDETVGYLAYEPGQTEIATFVYDKNFQKNNISPSPLYLPLGNEPFTFNNISMRTFHGLPGFIADSLPDKFGNQLIDQYFAAKGIPTKDITALDRLLYVGSRSMGALTYEPHYNFVEDTNTKLDIQSLCELSKILLNKKSEFTRKLKNAKQEQALKLLKVGSSAGGARSKALVAIDDDKKLYDGTVTHPFTCRYYLLKFDVKGNSDRDHVDPKGMTKIEYIYSIIADKCDIFIPKTDYIIDGDDFHFLIERFDRYYIEPNNTMRIHYISWCGISHADRDVTGAHSYEQLILIVRQLGLGQDAIKEIFHRAVFNIVGRNHDDHTKNFGFLMGEDGQWVLSPAFDMTYSYDPSGKWTRQHQVKFNNKQDNFTRNDIVSFGKYCNLTKKQSLHILQQTIEAFNDFEKLAKKYNVPDELKKTILTNLRINI